METCIDMFKTGLVSVSFRSLSAEEIIKLTKKAGLGYVEWGSDVHAVPQDKQALYEIVRLQEQCGIECCSYGTYFRIGKNDISEIYDYIDAAKILGTDVLRLWCGDKGSQDYSEDELERIYRDCKTLAKIGKENGVVFCLECHINTLTDCLDSAKALMDRVGCDNFCMYWQPNQFKTEQENIQYAKFASDITKRIHVFNWEGKNKYPLAEAKEIWQTYFRCFESGYALLEFVPDNNPETLITEAKALFEILGELE